MCGIVGYSNVDPVIDPILDSLELLEYRGYDSAGIALQDKDSGTITIYKCAGRVAELRELCRSDPKTSVCGIGHTRWATHGGVTDSNAHPHKIGKVVLVHNGIIENYIELKDRFDLSSQLRSETDSEIIAGVINTFYDGDPVAAITNAVRHIRGTFSLVMMFENIPGVVYAIRNVSPIVTAYTKHGTMLASDVVALNGNADKYASVPEYHVLELRSDEIRLYDLNGMTADLEFIDIDWNTSQGGKAGYPFYMEKEIMEQPAAVHDTIMPRIKSGHIDLSHDGIPDDVLTDCTSIVAIACGTSMNAALVAKAMVQSMLHIRMAVECASEFIYSDPIIDDHTLVVAISQSGETIDTLAALRQAKKLGAKSIAVVNVKGSSIARESDHVMFTQAGPEIAVASTKAFTTQIAALYLLFARMAVLRGIFDAEQEKLFIYGIMNSPGMIDGVLASKDEIHNIARNLVEAKNTFMIGRGVDYSILLEGALKLKEISYIHTEAYASGELKHGTIALITDESPVIALMTQKKVSEKELSNIQEVKARGANVVLFVRSGFSYQKESFQNVFVLPNAEDMYMVFPATVALQLLAYYVSMDKGLDVDKPRNLAKVVTVE